jgi:hypothetical protein
VLAYARDDLVACECVSFVEFDPMQQREDLDKTMPRDDSDYDVAVFGATIGTAPRAATPTAAATCSA